MITLAMKTALMLALSSAPAQADAERAAPYIPDGQPWCQVNEPPPPDDPHPVFEQLEAPRGGAWWLSRRSQDNIGRLDDGSVQDLILVDGSGNELTFEGHLTPAALAVPVPEDAAAGGTYLLHDGIPEDGWVLRVSSEEIRAASVAVSGIAQGAPVQAASCSAECFEEGHAVPRSSTLELRLSGDPVIADAWMKLDGTVASLLDERRLDSRLLGVDNADEVDGDTNERLHTFGVGLDIEGPVTPTWIVELRDPNTLEVLAHEELSEPLLEKEYELTDENAWLPLCSEFADCPGCYDDCLDCYMDPGPCGAAGGEVPWAFSLVLGGVLLVRRRRRRW